MTSTELYLLKRRRIIVPPLGEPTDSQILVATMDRNLQALGFTFTRRLGFALSRQSEAFLTALYGEIVPVLQKAKGAHVDFRPMYPNFPRQVMEMSEVELYWRAIFHYLTLQSPNEQAKEERLPMAENEGSFLAIDLGSEADFQKILTDLAAGNASLSPTDKEALVWLLRNLPNSVELLPPNIPQKETVAIIIATFLSINPCTPIIQLAKTATDLLRMATELCGGDVSLAERAVYKKISRPLRRALLQALESMGSLEEDLLRHQGKWLRLAEQLHPGEYPQFPRVQSAFKKLRNDLPIPTFASKTELALERKDWEETVAILSTRPGDFLRRLDHVLRASPAQSEPILKAFSVVISACATPALLNLHHHFDQRMEPEPKRNIFPKGSSTVHVIPPATLHIQPQVCQEVVALTEATLLARFAKLPPLGPTYIDPELKNYLVPFAQRTASKALRSLARGSQALLDDESGPKDTLRFFIWWKNGRSRTDLDLSCHFLDDDFGSVGTVAYYNLAEYGGTHSGDIVDAPEGAAEVIDLSISKLRERGITYVAAIVMSFTSQPFKELPECFCGWMTRDKPQSGEIFEAKTVKHKSDLTGTLHCSIPVIIDLKTRRAIWCDLDLKSNPRFAVNVANNQKGVSVTCAAIAHLKKPSLHTLLALHAKARGKVVEKLEEAESIFLADFAYENDRIAAEFIR